ncbi:hypothetical protein CKM354_001102800 [Cercospora kikuchii]|uniref:Uncharacterized protein n=1 Tax=Cercospora kikuchii TaxID=84275 RepID=A0A9P3CZV5_9PEZI|nr:uncharacterized protein CKM354_001102800 [Cercospora kikuchii]GIZ47953.1 hypothetical protein CKM354_001102800 [Cercospora kikuchii]
MVVRWRSTMIYGAASAWAIRTEGLFNPISLRGSLFVHMSSKLSRIMSTMFSKLILPPLSLELASFLSIKCSRDGPSREVFVLHVGLTFDRIVFSEYDFVRIQGFTIANLAISGAAISSSIPVVAQLPGPLAAEVAELLSTDAGDVVTAIGQLDPLPAVWAALVVFSSYKTLKRHIKILLRSSMVFCGRLAVVGNANL